VLKKPIINTAVQVVGKLATGMVGLVVTSILTRKLGAEIYGQYTLITSVFIFLDSLADFGTRIIGVRELSNVSIKEEKDKEWSRWVWTRLLMTSLAYWVGLLLVMKFGSFGKVRLEAMVALTMIWFTSLAGSLEIVWQTLLKMEMKVAIEVLFPIIFLGLLWGWRGEISLLWVFGGYLVARIVSLGIGWGVFKKFTIFNLQFSNWEAIKKALIMAWPMGLYLLVFTTYDRAIDSLMIDRFIGIKEVAWYGLAYKIYGNLLQPAYFFVGSLFPLLSSKMTKKRELFKISGGMLGAGLVVIMPILYMMAPLMINILGGNGFEPAVVVLRWLLLAMGFSYFGHLVGFTLISRNGQMAMLKFGVITLVFNTLANLYIIPRFGINGAAVVTVLTEGLSLCLMSMKLWKMTRK
jgi:O-antigen/teichoic acid export membrane protein